MEWTVICGNTIEGITMQLSSNNMKKTYQKISMTNTETSKHQSRCIIAPVDFYTVSTAIMCNTKITGMMDDFENTWSEEALKQMLEEVGGSIKNEV